MRRRRYTWKKHQQKAKAAPVLDPPLFAQSTLVSVAFTSTLANHKTTWRDQAEVGFVGVSSVGTKAQWTTIAA